MKASVSTRFWQLGMTSDLNTIEQLAKSSSKARAGADQKRYSVKRSGVPAFPVHYYCSTVVLKTVQYSKAE